MPTDGESATVSRTGSGADDADMSFSPCGPSQQKNPCVFIDIYQAVAQGQSAKKSDVQVEGDLNVAVSRIQNHAGGGRPTLSFGCSGQLESIGRFGKTPVKIQLFCGIIEKKSTNFALIFYLMGLSCQEKTGRAIRRRSELPPTTGRVGVRIATGSAGSRKACCSTVGADPTGRWRGQVMPGKENRPCIPPIARPGTPP